MCKGCHAGNGIFICGGNEEQGEWERTTKLRPRGWNGKIYVPCCNRLEYPRNTVSRWFSAYGGYVAGYETRCAPDAGCNINPGYKRTAHLRYYE